ncbi:hypothetical protein [Argonema antarcticum]|nr:hypothetical protein [Argonema antarcticum]MCL1472793.1 hypothetical protein [Argonema antarcticum A004/B2]
MARGSEQNLVHVHVLWLAHGEGDRPEHHYTVWPPSMTIACRFLDVMF